MKASQGRIGRVFVIRLEDGDEIPSCIEQFCRKHNIRLGHVILIGGIGDGQIVVGPRDATEIPVEPMILPLDGAHEVAGVGVIAPGEQGDPTLHIHASLGRAGHSITGCLRPGVTTWLVGEVVIYEILDAHAVRIKDESTGLPLLEPKDLAEE